MSNNKNITETTLALAKARYMMHESVTLIAKELKVPRTTLQNYINKTWREERTLLENEVIATFADSRLSILNKISKHSADIILKSLEALTTRDKPPTVLEARAAVTIFESLDKIMRLDKGSPTDIIGETAPMTIIELKQKFAEIDPFYKGTENEEITEAIITTNNTNSDSGSNS